MMARKFQLIYIQTLKSQFKIQAADRKEDLGASIRMVRQYLNTHAPRVSARCQFLFTAVIRLQSGIRGARAVVHICSIAAAAIATISRFTTVYVWHEPSRLMHAVCTSANVIYEAIPQILYRK
eukprot:scaffold265219_cov21-Prasinocladus_malaysianus.AAC.1